MHTFAARSSVGTERATAPFRVIENVTGSLHSALQDGRGANTAAHTRHYGISHCLPTTEYRGVNSCSLLMRHMVDLAEHCRGELSLVSAPMPISSPKAQESQDFAADKAWKWHSEVRLGALCLQERFTAARSKALKPASQVVCFPRHLDGIISHLGARRGSICFDTTSTLVRHKFDLISTMIRH